MNDDKDQRIRALESMYADQARRLLALELLATQLEQKLSGQASNG